MDKITILRSLDKNSNEFMILRDQLCRRATERLGSIKINEDGIRRDHGECLDILYKSQSDYVIFKFEVGNEIIHRKTIGLWFK